MSLGQNVTGQNVTRENAIMNCEQPFLFSFLQNSSALASAPTVEMTTKNL